MGFWKFIKNAATEAEPEEIVLRIEGEIVDDDDLWLYEWFGIKAISPNTFKEELENYAGKDITVWIDSYGGSVFAAAGMYNALMEHKGAVTVKIDGKAMSAASIIAMAGGKVLMSPVAIMMIHNPLTEVYGYATDLRKTADVLDEVKEAIMNAYQVKTNRSRNKLSQMMDDESWMSAKTAIKEGFADEMLYAAADKVAEPIDMAFNRHAIMNSTAEAVKRMVALQKPPENPPEEPPKTLPDDTTLKLELAKLDLELAL
ncbi:MAG: Clp protease ClpP [Eubacteriales bacterium]|nr:Clp protease ClpP [Eubacteriales bacterium]